MWGDLITVWCMVVTLGEVSLSLPLVQVTLKTLLVYEFPWSEADIIGQRLLVRGMWLTNSQSHHLVANSVVASCDLCLKAEAITPQQDAEM